jgi:hypothetical protein
MSKVSQREPRRVMPVLNESIAEQKEIASELVECVTDYARANPGYAALWCIGIGFVLGWKLKPW